MSARRIAEALVDRHGRTFAAEAGITLADKPSPLFRLLTLALLMSAPISVTVAVATARELAKTGLRTPTAMAEATWQERVDALGRGGYRRYDEKTATMLGELSARVLDEYDGDLRRLRGEAGVAEKALQEFKGIGPAGAAIFLREVQSVWPEVAPYVDPLAAQGAERLGLPTDAAALAELVARPKIANLVAGCVRAARSDDVVADVRSAT